MFAGKIYVGTTARVTDNAVSMLIQCCATVKMGANGYTDVFGELQRQIYLMEGPALFMLSEPEW